MMPENESYLFVARSLDREHVSIRNFSEVWQTKDNRLVLQSIARGMWLYLAQKEIEMSNARLFRETWFASIASFLFRPYESPKRESIFPSFWFGGKSAKKPFSVVVV